MDLPSCSLSPHCVVPRIRRPDDRITFDTQTTECLGHDTHPPTHACSSLGNVNPKLVRIRFGAPAPPSQPDREQSEASGKRRDYQPVTQIPETLRSRRLSSASIFGCGDTPGMEGCRRVSESKPLATIEMKGKVN